MPVREQKLTDPKLHFHSGVFTKLKKIFCKISCVCSILYFPKMAAPYLPSPTVFLDFQEVVSNFPLFESGLL